MLGVAELEVPGDRLTQEIDEDEEEEDHEQHPAERPRVGQDGAHVRGEQTHDECCDDTGVVKSAGTQVLAGGGIMAA